MYVYSLFVVVVTMCGILGITPRVEHPRFAAALQNLSHRGPDGSSMWYNDQLMLGHTRLAILDLSDNAAQPMTRDHLTIVYNGEVYNFVELRKELESIGYKFTSESDTEVILVAYAQWGSRCLQKFNGMWAFAIWDDRKGELFLSRDRFGKKPLFYSFVNGQFIFASEMKGIFPFLPQVRVSKHFEWCKQHLFDYESTDKCLIEHVKRFPAASYAYYKPGDHQLQTRSFWNTLDHLVKPASDYSTQVEEFRELFIDACRIRMRSDVPIGVTLSGGIDSTATMCAVSHVGRTENNERVTENWHQGFTATFGESILDESGYSRKVAEHLGIHVNYFEVDPQKGIDHMFCHLYHLEELYLTSPAPTMQIYETIRDHGVYVSIDGHGADELFAGYNGEVLHLFMDAGLNISKIRDVIETYNGMTGIDSEQVKDEKANGLSYFRYLYYNHGIKGSIKHLLRSLTGKEVEDPSNGKFGHFNACLYDLFHKRTLPTILRNIDRTSMAHGVETRMPFLDHRLVSYTFSLPSSSKVKNGFTKSIVRDAFKCSFPCEVLNRKEKIGLNTPIVDWMKGPWKEFLLDEVHSASFKQCSLIDPRKTKDLIYKVINNKNALFSDGEQAWTALSPYLWEKAVLKRKPVFA